MKKSSWRKNLEKRYRTERLAFGDYNDLTDIDESIRHLSEDEMEDEIYRYQLAG